MRTKAEVERARNAIKDLLIRSVRRTGEVDLAMASLEAGLSWCLGEDPTGFSEMIDGVVAGQEKMAAIKKAAKN